MHMPPAAPTAAAIAAAEGKDSLTRHPPPHSHRFHHTQITRVAYARSPTLTLSLSP